MRYDGRTTYTINDDAEVSPFSLDVSFGDHEIKKAKKQLKQTKYLVQTNLKKLKKAKLQKLNWTAIPESEYFQENTQFSKPNRHRVYGKILNQ